MKNKLCKISFLLILIMGIISCKKDDNSADSMIIDHNCTDLSKIPANWIEKAKTDLHIAYEHTSHGNQIIVGMNGLRDLNLPELIGYKGDIYIWSDGITNGALDLDNDFASGDLGEKGDTSWATRTRTYLNESANSDVNVVMWSWCGGVSSTSEEGINTYLQAMSKLETDYPHVKFVYMTGHLDGTGVNGNLHKRNEQIRKYCRDNSKILFDFADIESYDPDGNYYLDKFANDECRYDSNGSGALDAADGNWATTWQGSHTQNVYWYACNPDHTQAVNGNRKAYAAWWLWARLAGWSGK